MEQFDEARRRPPRWRARTVERLRRWRLFARLLAPLALTSRYSFAYRVGWLESAVRREPVDRDGRPLPWWTYGAIRFLGPRLQPSMRVFEYGSGNSTLWLAERVGAVVSVEHDRAWQERVAARAPANVTCRWVPLGGRYPESVLEWNTDSVAPAAPFDLVIIDGRRRAECTPHAVRALAPAGVILFDNTDRVRYRQALRALAEAGFRRLDFFGLGPVNASAEQTSILYRPDNVLGI